MSMEAVYEYENDKKMRLVDRCLQSEALKRKLQGLNELKDIVKSVTYGSERNKFIVIFIANIESLDSRAKSIRKDLSHQQSCSTDQKIRGIFQIFDQ